MRNESMEVRLTELKTGSFVTLEQVFKDKPGSIKFWSMSCQKCPGALASFFTSRSKGKKVAVCLQLDAEDAFDDAAEMISLFRPPDDVVCLLARPVEKEALKAHFKFETVPFECEVNTQV